MSTTFELHQHQRRLLGAEDMLRRVRPHFPKLGISRLGRSTGLDVIGVPVSFVTRPLSLSTAVNQGKGLTGSDADIGAVMEGVEYACAERFQAPDSLSKSYNDTEKDPAFLSPLSTTRILNSALCRDQQVRWARATDLLGGPDIFVPEELVRLDLTQTNRTHTKGLYLSSDGLGAGASVEEAVFQALCELIERDAMAAYLLRPRGTSVEGLVPTAHFEPLEVTRLAQTIEEAGFILRLFDITTDLSVPVYCAFVLEPQQAGHNQMVIVSRGTGCDPSPARAAMAAILEAIQTRLTAISGARDDLAMKTPSLAADNSAVRQLLAATPSSAPPAQPRAEPPALGLSDLIGRMIARIEAARAAPLLAVALGGAEFGAAVVRVIAPKLEVYAGKAGEKLGLRGFGWIQGIQA